MTGSGGEVLGAEQVQGPEEAIPAVRVQQELAVGGRKGLTQVSLSIPDLLLGGLEAGNGEVGELLGVFFVDLFFDHAHGADEHRPGGLLTHRGFPSSKSVGL